ncbi:NAD-dependent epimerase/dehydratase family protein [Methylogaea oryzae]|uniref:UDP-glucose 4-epimerase n=2 Tax=Methylogaea oryzae TaxID=1295382 RepID=A0A8D4VNS8_9GAMM|nr:NAD-dependent epimerase/dehydratase family protein [Methylogaea oryzae]BBL69934.1 UDP-glucose 4-epimerase [Methylogaea oryzae]
MEHYPVVGFTGATGLVGQRLGGVLAARQRSAVALVRGATAASLGAATEVRAIGDIAEGKDFSDGLRGLDALIHLAARVHVMRETAADPLAEFRRVNTDGTERLARAAVRAGVRRFVYVSTAKVNGEATALGSPFREADPARPQDPYAISKWEAEQALWRVAAETGLEVVVVRPPLVYGPRVGGNFLRLLRWVRLGVPLPLASVRNRRSLVYVGNLADALMACVDRPEAAGKTYLVSDDQVFSTPELLRALASAMGVGARLWPCPPALLALAGRLLGKSGEIERLAGSLELDSSVIRRELHWRAPFDAAQGLAETAAWFKGESGHA